ncbi:UDP-glucose 4-epimerase [Lentzea pudingi]|uniref:UDP-glucose 4-epimerase n=1 Tax=Lentzea pudingi TaxID=1789439 RepID=A0ABQ2H8Z5_9PSEU|nr:NAD-dependent epimerase/dehydratase family protein [Lentzea pudingi]GGM69480.1 UDP-glucose 4-epimerase [Lentzea pudingi]
MATVTVLGATGFIGSAVLRTLARQEIHLRAVARKPAEVPPGPAQVEVVTADLTDRDALANAVEGSDAVVYLLLGDGGWRAAEEGSAERVNVGVMADLLELLGDDVVLVYGGAASQVGVPQREPLNGTEPDRPETAYDRQKLRAERLLLRESRVRGVSLRLPTVFGESTPGGGHDRGVVSAMVNRALDGQPLTMWHDGTVRRDLVHVDDIAVAFAAALEHADALAGRHWLLGAGRGDALGDVFRLISGITSEHTGAPPVEVTSVQAPSHAPVTDFRSVTIDSSAFRAVTGWRPEIPLGEGIHRTVAALARKARP